MVCPDATEPSVDHTECITCVQGSAGTGRAGRWENSPIFWKMVERYGKLGKKIMTHYDNLKPIPGHENRQLED